MKRTRNKDEKSILQDLENDPVVDVKYPQCKNWNGDLQFCSDDSMLLSMAAQSDGNLSFLINI